MNILKTNKNRIMKEIEFNKKIYSLDKNGFVSYKDAKEIVKVLKIETRTKYRTTIKKFNPKILPSNPNIYYKRSLNWISWGEYLSTSLDISSYLTYSELQNLVIESGIKSKTKYIDWIKEKGDKYPNRPDIVYKNYGWISWRNFFNPTKKISYSHKKKNFPTYEELKSIVSDLGINTKNKYKYWVRGKNNYPSHPNNTYKGRGWISWGSFFNKRETPSYEKLKNIIKSLNIKTMDEYKVWARDNNYPISPDKCYVEDWISWSTFLSSNNLSSVEKTSLYVSYNEAKDIIRSKIGIINSFKDWKTLYKSYFEKDLRIPSNPQMVYKDKGWINWYDWLGKDPNEIISSGESFLRENLKFIDYEVQKTFDWLINKSNLYLDLYIPSLKIAIEVQGIQHFKSIEFFGGEEGLESTIERDELKFNLCKEHDITVLYYVHDNTIRIPQEFLDRHKYLRSLDELINEIKDFGYGT